MFSSEEDIDEMLSVYVIFISLMYYEFKEFTFWRLELCELLIV